MKPYKMICETKDGKLEVEINAVNDPDAKIKADRLCAVNHKWVIIDLQPIKETGKGRVIAPTKARQSCQ